MLCTLSSIKSRLSIPEIDTTHDALLTNAIKSITARFDKETNRTLARTIDFTQEFPADDTEILAACYPIESVTKFELKQNETNGWQLQTGIECLIRSGCIICLARPVSAFNLQPSTGRVTHTAGYVLPGSAPAPGQTPLPGDLEQAAIEQIAAWFQHRDLLGLKTAWPSGGVYQQFLQSDLLLEVKAVLQKYKRISI